MYQASIIFDNEIAPKRGAKLPFGIHTNISLKEVEHKPNEYFEIVFEDSEGKYANKRFFAPNGKYPAKIKLPDGTERTETVAEALERERINNMSHLVKLLHILTPETYDKVSSDSYEGFVAAASKMLNQAKTNKKLNIKTIYDKEGKYTELGRYPDYVEEYVEGKAPTLTYTKYEQNERSTYKGGNEPKQKSSDLDDILS